MKKLMHKIMLSCDEATKLIAIESFKQLSMIERIKLAMHKMACVYCRRFALFNETLDQHLPHVCRLPHDLPSTISDEKKTEIRRLIRSELEK